MNKDIKVIENGKVKKYQILLEFTSNDTHKKYIFYTDNITNNVYISNYKIKNDKYILIPIKDKQEIDMYMNILEDIKNSK